VLKLTPMDGNAQRATGDAYFALRDYADAANSYEAALRSASSSKPPTFDGMALADVYNHKGKSYLEMQQYDKALADFKNAIRNDKNFALAYYNRGETYYLTGQLSDAIEDVAKAISLQGTPPCKWPYTLAKAYQAKKDYTNAASYYTNCINLDSAIGLPDAVYNLGRCQSELQNFPGALSSYNRALSLRLDTAVATFHLEMGTVYLHVGKFDSAYTCYNTVYAKDTTNGFALYGLASAQLLAGKTDESLVWFDKCFQTRMVKYNDAKRDKLIAKIWDDKRFQALKRKYN
jgi:tetratricopeptide (TPR) repeat protein